MNMLEKGEEIAIVDLRHELEVEHDSVKVPGAIWITLDELESRHLEIPRDRDVILYCSLPNEATSARAALQLLRRGVINGRPLLRVPKSWRGRRRPPETPN